MTIIQTTGERDPKQWNRVTADRDSQKKVERRYSIISYYNNTVTNVI